MTPCQKEYLEATGGPPGMVGQFIPHCERDGSYSPLQCHASTGFCWCSTSDGKKIPNTAIRGMPNCKFEGKPLSWVMSLYYHYQCQRQ